MPEIPHQSALGVGIAQANGHGASAYVVMGYTSEQVGELLRDAGTASQARIDELANQLNVTGDALRGFLSILKQDEVPIEQLKDRLLLIAQRYTSMMTRFSVLDLEDDEAQACIGQARDILLTAASALDYERVDELLFRAEEAQDRSLRGVEALEREAHEASVRLRHSKASTRAQRAELSYTRLDYLQAAEHLRAAAAFVEQDAPSLRREYLVQAANALRFHGDEKGDSYILEQCLALNREILREFSHEQNPLDWGRTQSIIGNVLRLLGGLETGTEYLEEAVFTLREALSELTRETVPLEWAATQTILGAVLEDLGERENKTEILEEAVTAYRDALYECIRENDPLGWGMTQNNLGNALRALGERESGTERLEEAVAACREALKEHTREQAPLEWAMTLNNLGGSLRQLGEREFGVTRMVHIGTWRLVDKGAWCIEEAIFAFREALKEYTRERVPLKWAMTQMNLGNALDTLGAREIGTGRQEEAIAAYRDALKEYTRARLPLMWAMAQSNLGATLMNLSTKEREQEYLDGAVHAFREALKEQTRDSLPMEWARTQYNLGIAFLKLGRRGTGTQQLKRARVALASARDVHRAAESDVNKSNIEILLTQIDSLIAGRSAL